MVDFFGLKSKRWSLFSAPSCFSDEAQSLLGDGLRSRWIHVSKSERFGWRIVGMAGSSSYMYICHTYGCISKSLLPPFLSTCSLDTLSQLFELEVKW